MAAGVATSIVGSSNEVTVEGIEKAPGDFMDKKPSDDHEGSTASPIDFTDDFTNLRGKKRWLAATANLGV